MKKHMILMLCWVLVACTWPSAGVPPTPPASIEATKTPQGAAGTPAPTAPTVAPMTWATCDDKVVSAEDRDTYECGTVAVPLDYANPDGKKITIALIRIPATKARKGAILYNPGGPGGSGFEYVAMGGQSYINTLGLESFDFVGFDPRGVDRSNGIRCQSDADTDKYMYPDSTPDTPEEKAFLEEADYAFANACKAKYGDELQFYSTANTARDMDMIRRAMGDDTISYLGVSYGTYLGAVYASMFPENVRAMVLDSALQPTDDTIEEQYLTQLQGFALAMENWIGWCERDTTCAFHATDVGARWDALYAQYDANPVPAADGRVANQLVIERATIEALYSESRWPILGEALAKAEKGDTAGVWALADEYYSRNEDGTYPTMQQSNNVINCASGLAYDAVTTGADALYQKMIAASPHFTHDLTVEDLQRPSDCTMYMPAATQPTLRYQGDAPILIVAGENDPATPLRWGTKMREAMGASARLVTYAGEGHGQVLSSKCVNALASDVLVGLTLPSADVRCEADPVVEAPAWWGEIPQPTGVKALNNNAIASSLGLKPTDGYVQAWAVPDAANLELLKIYGAPFDLAGFFKSGDVRDATGAKFQYYMSESKYVAVLVVDAATLATSDWKSARMLVPDGQALLVYMYFPE